MEFPFSVPEKETLQQQGPTEALRFMIRDRIEEIDDLRGFDDKVCFDRQKSLHNVIAYVRAVAAGMVDYSSDTPFVDVTEEEARGILEECSSSLAGEVIGYEELCRREQEL